MTAQDYPKLPLPMYINLAAGLPGRAVVEYFTADQMRAYVDADRALRVPDADPPQEFIDYMARNYYGDVVFSDSAWHARAIWRAAIFALKSSQPERKPLPQGEPVAVVDEGDDGCFVEILPNVNIRLGDKLYTHPAHTEAEVQQLLAMAQDNRMDAEDDIRRILGVSQQEPAP